MTQAPPEHPPFRPDPDAPDAFGALGRAMRREPAERAPRAFAAGAACALAGAWFMHQAAVSPAWPLLAGVITAAAAYRWLSRAARKRAHAKHEYKRNHGADAATLIVALAAWAGAATWAGPAAGPHRALLWTWLAGTVVACGWLRKHEAVARARGWRLRRAKFNSEAHALGVRGAHMIEHKLTRLGERYRLDTRYTSRRASQIAAGPLAELEAERRGLPRSRVRVVEGPIAGTVDVSIREKDPWANPVPHPVLDPHPEIVLPVPRTIRAPVTVGIDPETGTPLLLPLITRGSARRVSVVGAPDAGKTVLLNNVSEGVTAAEDALLIRINLSIKGDGEAMMWAPCCHLTALGRKQAGRGIRVMRTVNKVIEWRSQQPRLTDDFIPSPDDPLFVVVIDELPSATAIPGFAAELEEFARNCREYGGALVTAKQRGTSDWEGGANIRAMYDLFCLGKVNRAGEAVHAAGEMGMELPNMARYGEGHAGVWVIAELGGGYQAGRTFMLKDPPDIRRLAESRAHAQPDLNPALAEYLGDGYAALLASDHYARWAASAEGRRYRGHSPGPAAGPEPDPQDLATESHEEVTESDEEEGIVTTPEPGGQAPPDPEDQAPDEDDGQDYDPQGTLAAHDFPPDFDALPEHLRDRARKLYDTNQENRRTFADNPLPAPNPRVTDEQREVLAGEKWRADAERIELPGETREQLMGLLAGEGTSIRKVAAALDVKRWTAHMWLLKLSLEGVARLDGGGAAQRWTLTRRDDAGGQTRNV